MGTMCSRVLQVNHGPKHHGTNSPLNQAEEELVTICIQMGKIRQPLSVKEGIDLMNSLMRGTHFEKNVAMLTFAGMTFHVEQLDPVGGRAFCKGMGTGL